MVGGILYLSMGKKHLLYLVVEVFDDIEYFIVESTLELGV
jgi:hypothetical protein